MYLQLTASSDLLLVSHSCTSSVAARSDALRAGSMFRHRRRTAGGSAGGRQARRPNAGHREAVRGLLAFQEVLFLP